MTEMDRANAWCPKFSQNELFENLSEPSQAEPRLGSNTRNQPSKIKAFISSGIPMDIVPSLYFSFLHIGLISDSSQCFLVISMVFSTNDHAKCLIKLNHFSTVHFIKKNHKKAITERLFSRSRVYIKKLNLTILILDSLIHYENQTSWE